MSVQKGIFEIALEDLPGLLDRAALARAGLPTDVQFVAWRLDEARGVIRVSVWGAGVPVEEGEVIPSFPLKVSLQSGPVPQAGTRERISSLKDEWCGEWQPVKTAEASHG